MSKSSTFGAPSSKRSKASIDDATSKTSIEMVNPSLSNASIAAANPSKKEIHRHSQSPPHEPFDHDAKKYKFTLFCLTYHVKTGTFVAGILTSHLLLALIWDSFTTNTEKTFKGYSDFAKWLLWIPIIISLFVGVLKKNHYLLLPYAISGIIAVNGFVISIISGILVLCTGSSKEWNEASTWAIIGYFAKYFNYAVWFALFAWVVFKCYRYFLDLKSYRGKVFIGDEP